jgi:hypothetical protein
MKAGMTLFRRANETGEAAATIMDEIARRQIARRRLYPGDVGGYQTSVASTTPASVSMPRPQNE